MSNVVKHGFQSALPDGPADGRVQPSHWNAEHAFAGGADGALLVRDSTQSDGANWSSVYTGDVTIAGRLGIGTVAPNERLTVNGNIALAAPDQRFTLPRASGGGFQVLIGHGFGETTPDTFSVIADPSGTQYFLISQTGPKIAFPNGNVGIGTISPAATLHVANGAVALDEIGDPAAPVVDRVLLYARDNGVGKTQLVVRFNTGAVQVLATEP